MLNIIGQRRWFFLISALVILFGLISLGIFGLKPGIDFTGGSRLTVKFVTEVERSELQEELTLQGHEEAVLQRTEEGSFIIRTKELKQIEKERVVDALEAKFGSFTYEPSFDSVSPILSQGKVNGALIAVAVAAIGILLYITWAFRRLPSPFRYGTCAIIALVHDVMVAIGIFSFLGMLLNIEIDLMFVTGLLAIIGYSVNDTIVVFDRVRENLLKGVSRDFEKVVNISLVETLGRSLNTSLTTLIVILALFLFVGASIHNFALLLMIGAITGTYSSIGVASTLLVVWNKKEWGRFVDWVPGLSRLASK